MKKISLQEIVAPVFVLACLLGIALAAQYSSGLVAKLPITAEEAAEQVDGESYGGSQEAHSGPRWRSFRAAWIKDHPTCQWAGCGNSGPGLNVHHVLPESWVAKVGRPDLGYTHCCGQDFLTLCRSHHELAHNIGHGGSWSIFNPDAVHDARVGKWNSRGKSAWFKSEAVATEWIQSRIKEAEIAK